MNINNIEIDLPWREMANNVPTMTILAKNETVSFKQMHKNLHPFSRERFIILCDNL